MLLYCALTPEISRGLRLCFGFFFCWTFRMFPFAWTHRRLSAWPCKLKRTTMASLWQGQSSLSPCFALHTGSNRLRWPVRFKLLQWRSLNLTRRWRIQEMVFAKRMDLWDGGVQAPVILPRRHREKLLCTCLNCLKSSLFYSAVMLNTEPQTAT